MMFYDKDLINLAPRKPDWDLKRDVAKKLEKLERRTQRAIAELISMYYVQYITTYTDRYNCQSVIFL